MIKELNLQEQCEIQGGGLIGTAIIYLLLGCRVYKLIRSSKKYISVPRLVKLEWH